MKTFAASLDKIEVIVESPSLDHEEINAKISLFADTPNILVGVGNRGASVVS